MEARSAQFILLAIKPTPLRAAFRGLRSAETSCETPRSAMVTPNSRFIRAMMIGLAGPFSNES